MKSGDPIGFKDFLTKSGLSPGMFPRYVGNRLHVLFHLSGVLFSKRSELLQYLKKYCTSQQLRLALMSDLQNEDISVQLQALGKYYHDFSFHFMLSVSSDLLKIGHSTYLTQLIVK